jgi:hypothetical protein
MTTIVTNPSLDAVLSALISNNSQANNIAAAPSQQRRASDATARLGFGPATKVSLSDQAKTFVAKATASDELPQSAKWAAQAKADNIGLMKAGLGDADKWIGIARQLNAGQQVQITPGRVPSDDESYQIAVNLALANQFISLENSGNSDAAQALKSAFNDGTLNIQKAETVPDLNMDYKVWHFADAGGGGSSSSMSLNPTGAIKAAIDNGRAMTGGGGDRGAFYYSW